MKAVSFGVFQSGARWCALGDSITQEGWYHQFVELFYRTRFPASPLQVVNCGIAGDNAGGALKRLRRDCLDTDPTVVTVMLGMNDVGRELFGNPAPAAELLSAQAARAEDYDRNMRQLVAELVASGIQVVLLTPSIFDDTADLPEPRNTGCGAALKGFARTVQAIARDFTLPVVDFNGAMSDINKERQKNDPHFTIVGPDRVHPAEPGHFLMAYEFLRTQKAQSIVAHTEIDIRNRVARRTDNCEISELAADDHGVSFTCLESALPFPVPSAAVPALDYVPFTREFNQETLMVSGLQRGNYTLCIDEQRIGSFTDGELAQGLNLASQENTPQSQQAVDVLETLIRKWDAVAKLRAVAFVEHCAWPDAGHPADAHMMTGKVTEWRTKLTQANQWCISMGDQYRDLKLREEELQAEVAALETSVLDQSRPRPHRVTIRLESPHTP